MFYKLLTLTTLACISPLTHSQQVHERDFGTYRVLSSIAPSESIAAEAAKSVNIPRQPDVAVLNVTILHGSTSNSGTEPPTVPGKISVIAINLLGAERSIELVKSQDGAWISYIGFFRFLPNEVLDFRIRVRPETEKTPLEMDYREKLWAPVKKP